MAHYKVLILIFFPCFIFFMSHGQETAEVAPLQDTLAIPTILKPVQITAYFATTPLQRLPSSAAVINADQLERHQGLNFVTVANTVAGVRMEERSPGSYRLSIRGSLLRSPFGIRNIKIYLEDIPMTDAGGNTYFNLMDPWAVSSMEILKGPDGSVFGANSGGVVILRPYGQDLLRDQVGLQSQVGAYGLFNQQARVAISSDDDASYRGSFNQSYQRSDGYREQSALKKMFFQTRHSFEYHWNKTESLRNQIKLIALYSDLDYETPGGLTEAQMRENPRHARLATPTTPGAVEQRAGIRNRTVLGGLTHHWQLTDHLKHTVSLFGSHTDFTNPFITNYEERMEQNTGLRTYFSYQRSSMKVHAGAEWQSGRYHIINFDNHGGQKGNLQAENQMRLSYHYYFLHAQYAITQRWLLESGLSLNFQLFENTQYRPVWMPKLASSYLITPDFSWRTTISKGFSPPSAAELRPSDNIINPDLAPEQGWNYETGLRWQHASTGFEMDASLFHYNMKNAIVRRLRDNGAEFFDNAGEVKQNGVELAVAKSWSQKFRWQGSWAWSLFEFSDYQGLQENYSGNALTGVPRHQVYHGLEYQHNKHWMINISHQYTSSIPLNDANAVYADPYHLLHAKVTYFAAFRDRKHLKIFAGVDNILNQTYSLGNDINAFGGRFFNPAPLRNFYLGVGFYL